MTETATIRVRKHVRERAARIANQVGASVPTVIERALEGYEQDLFWDSFDTAVERHKSDQATWDADEAERALWDQATVKAGLEPE